MKLEPANRGALAGIARLAHATQDKQGAIAAADAIVQVAPKDPVARLGRARAYHAAKNIEAALADIDEAIRLKPDLADAYVLRASIFKRRGDTDKALIEAALLARISPDDAYAQQASASIYEALGHRDEAMRRFDRSIEIKPLPGAYLARARLRPRTQIAERRADLDAALKLDPSYLAPLKERIDLAMEEGDHAKAIELLDAQIAMQGEKPLTLNIRGLLHLRMKRDAAAAKDFAAARAKADTAVLLNELCWEKAVAGLALETALAECDAALTKAPSDAAVLDSRGFVLLRLGRYDEAIRDFDAALKIEATQTDSLYGRGIAKLRRGDKPAGQADIAAAMKIDKAIAAAFARYGVTP